MSEAYVDLSQAIDARRRMAEYRDQAYLRLITQLNTQAGEIIKDDLGSQFVANCGRDLAGEVVRTCFNTSDYYLTVDQMLRRILVFSYEDEYDPIAEQKAIRGSVYNQTDFRFSISKNVSSSLEKLFDDMDASQQKLFIKENGRYVDKSLMTTRKNEHVERVKDSHGGVLIDEYTNEEGEVSLDKNGTPRRRLEVDHTQAAATATYNERYITVDGIVALKETYNSEDNFSMMHKSANASKGDVRVHEHNHGTWTEVMSEAEYKSLVNTTKKEYKREHGCLPTKEQLEQVLEDKGVVDITHRASPEQMTARVCEQWEKAKNETKKTLMEKGYLNEDGKVPAIIKREMIRNYRHSQNAESLVILSHTKYTSVAGDALGMTGASVGKILAGQIIYYAAPPLVYEIRGILREKGVTLHNALEKISSAGSRIGEYVLSHLKDICVNVAVNSLKKFVKCFMDILINLVKATVKKLLKMAKSLVMSTVDATRIIATPGTTRAQKADAVCNLYAVTITNCVVDLLFDFLSTAVHIPSLALFPLQILTSVVCSNLVMLILQEADLFDVRYGFKMNAIRELFASEYGTYEEEMTAAQSHTEQEIALLTDRARQECKEIYFHLQDLDAEEQSVRESLGALNQMFSMNIDFEGEWNQFLGKTPLALPSE